MVDQILTFFGSGCTWKFTLKTDDSLLLEPSRVSFQFQANPELQRRALPYSKTVDVCNAFVKNKDIRPFTTELSLLSAENALRILKAHNEFLTTRMMFFVMNRVLLMIL